MTNRSVRFEHLEIGNCFFGTCSQFLYKKTCNTHAAKFDDDGHLEEKWEFFCGGMCVEAVSEAGYA